MKKLYLIRHAKSNWKNGGKWDFMRDLSKGGLRDIETVGSYMALQKIKPDLILSSCAMRTQLTADKLAEKIGYNEKIEYMSELYLARPEMVLNVLSTQEDKYESIFFVGHNPELTELVYMLTDNDFSKFPTLGVLSISLNIDTWQEILKYAMPR